MIVIHIFAQIIGVILMTAYDKIGSLSEIYFNISDITETNQPSTLKTNLGKTFVEKEIPMRNTTDTVLEINGVITGLSRTSAQSLATAIENDRASLIALEDGYYRAYSDGKHSGNYVIVSGSLKWNDEANISGIPYRFTMTIKSW